MLYYKHMRFKMPLLSLLFVLAFGFFAPIFAITPQNASAALNAEPSQDEVQNKRKFYYEKLTVDGVEKLSIYTVQCENRNNCATVEQRGIMERWLVRSLGGTQSTSNLIFAPVTNDGKNPDLHSPEVIVNRTTLSKGGMARKLNTSCNSDLSNEDGCITFAVNDIEVAQAMLSKDSTAGSNQDGGAIGANGQNQNVEPSTPGSTTPEADAENSTSCEDSGVGNLGWIMCPVILAIDGGLNWVDSRINELLEIDADYYDNPEIRNAFSSIQRVAYIILVPVMLVMVISTALGFEFVSAYTVKKALPRLVMAVIFISVAYPLCVFLIQFFDSIGKGVVGLITSPFETKYGALTLSNLFEGNILTGIVTGFGGAVASIILLWLFGGTILLFAGVAFLVLLLRQMFVVALLLLAPVAILAWIFPGNDKLWNAWWGSFSKLLMMYPIIMGLIAIGRVFAFIIHGSDRSGAESVLQPIMIIIAYMIPYAFIPFTFKLAGGTFATLAGMADNKSKGLFDRQREKRAVKWERNGSRRILQARGEGMRRLADYSSRSGRGGKAASWAGRKLIGGYNLEAAMSAKQAGVGKEINDQIATGRDDAVRGLTVNKKAAKAAGELKLDSEGHMSNGLMRINKATKAREYKSLGGGWVSEAYVDEGQARWGSDTFAQQAALSYEMRKAMTSEQVGGISSRYKSLAKDTWGMSDTEAGGAWIGSAFENQGQHIEYKHTDWGNGQLKNSGFVSEVYEKKGSYPLAQMSAHTIKQLKAAYDSGDDSVKQKVKEIAQTFSYRTQGMEGDVPVTGGPAGTAGVSAPGAASVNREVKELYDHIFPQAQQAQQDNTPPPQTPGYM